MYALAVAVELAGWGTLKSADVLVVLVFWFANVASAGRDLAAKLLHLLFKSPAKLTEFNVALATLLSGIYLSPQRWPMWGGRDAITAALPPEVPLHGYASVLVLLGVSMHLGMMLDDPKIRRASVWWTGVVWCWTLLMLVFTEPRVFTTVWAFMMTSASFTTFHRFRNVGVLPDDERPKPAIPD